MILILFKQGVEMPEDLDSHIHTFAVVEDGRLLAEFEGVPPFKHAEHSGEKVTRILHEETYKKYF